MKPKILYLDIETSPMLVWTFGIKDQYIGLEQIEKDWNVLSFAAKWKNEKKVLQADLRCGVNKRNELKLLKLVWNLLDESDIVVGQNSKQFDIKKLNEKFLQYGLGSPSHFQQIDTLQISRKHFSPTSHKLEYRSKSLNKKYQKQSHSKYPGIKLWIACINGDKKAWDEMATYNVFDVLSTEEYHDKLDPWDNTINFNVYSEDRAPICSCGTATFTKKGYRFSKTGKHQIYKCTNCGKRHTSSKNLLSPYKRKSMLK